LTLTKWTGGEVLGGKKTRGRVSSDSKRFCSNGAKSKNQDPPRTPGTPGGKHWGGRKQPQKKRCYGAGGSGSWPLAVVFFHNR